jgi:hypothetical protein
MSCVVDVSVAGRIVVGVGWPKKVETSADEASTISTARIGPMMRKILKAFRCRSSIELGSNQQLLSLSLRAALFAAKQSPISEVEMAE